MRSRTYTAPLLVCLLVLSGCVGSFAVSDAPTKPALDSSTATSTTTTTTHDSPSNATAKQRALAAEEKRVEQALTNASGVTDDYSVGVYGEVGATVMEQTANGVKIRVVMSYSYQDDCPSGGYVDGLTTETIYLVTENGTELQSIEEAVKTPC